MNPLARLRQIKLKLGLVIVAAILTTVACMLAASALGVGEGWGAAAAILLALGVVQLLAHGMTAPLREMSSAAQAVGTDGAPPRVAVRGRDEVAQLAEAFNAMSAEIAETERMRRELVANVSHELRTPLSALQGTLENIGDGVQEPDERTVEAMHRQVSRLSRLVSRLLDLSGLEAEGFRLATAEFPAAGMLERCREEAAAHADGKPIRIDLQPPGLILRADEERLHQVVGNLLENALRFSPPGGPVDLRVAAGPGAVVEIAVSDSGPGIPAAYRERVFERFYRLDSARTDTGGGAGLGLPICRWIVSMHGGQIRAEENDGGGCRIVARMPIAARTAADRVVVGRG
jgi:signal transduction histidine kinase